MKNSFRHILELNLATLLVSSSGVLGKMISLPPSITILYRCVLAAIFLYVIARIFKISLHINPKKHFAFMASGAFFLALHWVTYYWSIRVAGVAVGMLAMFTFPLITTLLEPLYFKSKLERFNVFTSLLSLVGVAFIVPEFSVDNPITLGVLIGLLSALAYSIRNILNKKYVSIYTGTSVMFYQLLGCVVWLFPFLFFEEIVPQGSDWSLLIILSLVATALGHTLFVISLKNFSTSTASIISSVQPVYGIALAAVLMSENNPPRVFIGGGIILGIVLLQSIRQGIKSRA